MASYVILSDHPLRDGDGRLVVGAVLGQPGQGPEMITAALATSDRLVLAAGR